MVEYGASSDLIADPSRRLARAFLPRLAGLRAEALAVQAVITFLGDAAEKPILAGVVRQCDVDVNILGGNIQQIGGKRVGQLQVELKGGQTQAALAYLRDLGLRVEVYQ